MQVNLQKDVKKQPSYKKDVALCIKARVEKAVKYRWHPRNGCDGRSAAKIAITTIQVNLVLIAGMKQHKFTSLKEISKACNNFATAAISQQKYFLQIFFV